MKILISGASGMIAGHLIPVLESKGHSLWKLVRGKSAAENEIVWSSKDGFSVEEAAKLEGFDAVIHLAGDNVASENWSAEKKKKIRASRIDGTRFLIDALAKCDSKPKTLISASAIGFYGNREDEVLTEDSVVGEGFFPEICSGWEIEAMKAKDFGTRVVTPRIGVVLAPDGGALEKMLTPFKLGVGGVVGSGKQWMSWIAIEDLVGLIAFALENESIEGPLNATAPNPVTNETFTKTLGRVLHRPTFIPVPEFAIKLLFGEMGETLLLQGNRVVPKKALDAGYEFKFPELEEAIKDQVDSRQ